MELTNASYSRAGERISYLRQCRVLQVIHASMSNTQESLYISMRKQAVIQFFFVCNLQIATRLLRELQQIWLSNRREKSSRVAFDRKVRY